ERLLAIGIAELAAAGFSKVAWLDADIQFQDAAWCEKLARVLDRVAFCQAFSLARERPEQAGKSVTKPGFVYAMRQQQLVPSETDVSWGLAMGARTELLARTSLYDACIVGGGDVANMVGAIGAPREPTANSLLDQAIRLMQMNPRQEEHFRSWVKT